MRQQSLEMENTQTRLRRSWLDRVLRLLMTLSAILVLSSCGASSPEGGGPAFPTSDGGSSHGVSPDAGNPDAGGPQAGSPDAGEPDGGVSTQTIGVNGRVMDLAGQVKAGTWVAIKSGSFWETRVVDPGGNFTVPDVPIPYDVWVIVEGTSPWDYLRSGTATTTVEVGVTASVGLTSPSPTVLDLTRTDPGTEHVASIRGRVSGGIGFPTPGDYGTILAFSSPTGGALGSVNTISFETGAYLTDVHWLGPPEVSGTLHALQFQVGGQGPESYSGYGAASVQLTAGGVSSLEVPLAPVTVARVSGTYTSPPNYVGGWQVWMNFGADRGGLAIASGAAGPFSALTPNVPGATFWAFGYASQPTWDDDPASSVVIKSNLAADATSVALTSPPAPELNLPEPGAGNVSTGTRFSWTAPAGGVSILHVRPPGNSGPSFYVVTSELSASIPDLAGGGPMLPITTGYSWWVVGIGPFPGVDLAAPGIRNLLNGLDFEGGPPTSPVDGYVTNSFRRTFATSR